MTTIPQLDIPDILVDDGTSDNSSAGDVTPRAQIPSQSFNQPASRTHLSVDANFGQHGASDATWNTPSWQHPLSMPRSTSSTPSPPLSPSSLGFELHEASGNTAPSGEMRRRGSSVSPNQARDMLDDSAWMESIRRSTTARRSQHGSYRYADLG